MCLLAISFRSCHPPLILLSGVSYRTYISGILSTVYVVGLLGCLVLGALRGPNVFERSPPDVVETNSLNVTWFGKIDGMERWHQVSAVATHRFPFFFVVLTIGIIMAQPSTSYILLSILHL